MHTIKVVFKDTHFKYRFMKKLTKVKHYEKNNKVSLTGELTKLEREQDKAKRKKANELTELTFLIASILILA